MKPRQVFELLLAGVVLALPGCGTAGEDLPDYRYRMTVEVETPEGLKTGSSVIEVQTMVAGRNSIPTPGAVGHRLRGEAVTVDLGGRGMLFALLRSDDDSDWASNVMYRLAPKVPRVHDDDGKFNSSRDFKNRFMAMLERRAPIELPTTFPDVGHLKNNPARPMLVRFQNISNPTSVEKVQPDDLAVSFGQGVKLNRITLQFTNDPVTTGIEKKLLWLPNVYKMQLGNQLHHAGIPVGDFQALFSKSYR